MEVLPNHDSSVSGGLIAVEAIAQQVGPWQKLAALPGLDPAATAPAASARK